MKPDDLVNPDGLVNKGFIMDRRRGDDPGRPGRTFIVTGLYRSGTSLIASILRQVGIFMGAEINDIVHEDEAFARVIEGRDRAGLHRLINERDAAYGTWGFKLPMLCRWLDPADMALFNEPRIIIMFRDPVAISVRTALSEYSAPMQALGEAARDLAAMAAFAAAVPCPKLLVSYEKALMFPADCVDAIAQFCDLPHSDTLRAGLIGLIEPNRPGYIAGSRRRYEGIIEGVRDGQLYGWCRLTGIGDPVTLELLADGQPVCTFPADAFRQDLLDAGFGAGRHGFFLDLAMLKLRPESRVRIRVAGHGVELQNSGRELRGYA